MLKLALNDSVLVLD